MTLNDDHWTKTLRQATRNALTELDFASIGGLLRMKNANGHFGTVACDELSAGYLKVVDRVSEQVTVFRNVDELIRAAWVID